MKVPVNDIEMGYDRAGPGEPVLLIMGLNRVLYDLTSALPGTIAWE